RRAPRGADAAGESPSRAGHYLAKPRTTAGRSQGPTANKHRLPGGDATPWTDPGAGSRDLRFRPAALLQELPLAADDRQRTKDHRLLRHRQGDSKRPKAGIRDPDPAPRDRPGAGRPRHTMTDEH